MNVLFGLLISLILANVAHARSTTDGRFIGYRTHVDLPEAEVPGKSSFILPNEDTPKKGRHVYEALEEGLLISVGTERGPISLTLAPKITHLLQVDIDPAVVIYNRVNIALLKAAARSGGTIQEKMKLYISWKLSPLELRAALPGMRLDDGERDLLAKIAESSWWLNLSKKMAGHTFHSTEDTKATFDGPLRFVGVKYWRDPALAERVMTMADQGRMQAELLDLTDPMALSLLTEGIKASGLKVSGVDSSNVWFFADRKLKEMVRAFGTDSKGPLYIFTWLNDSHHRNYRVYTGITGEALAENGYMVDGDIQAAYGRGVHRIEQDVIKGTQGPSPISRCQALLLSRRLRGAVLSR